MTGQSKTHDLRTVLENIASRLAGVEDYVEISEDLYSEIKNTGELLLDGKKYTDPVRYRLYRIDSDIFISLRTERRINSLRVVVDGVGDIEFEGVDMNRCNFERYYKRAGEDVPDDDIIETINEWYCEACEVVFDHVVLEGGRALYDGKKAYIHEEETLVGFNHIDLESPDKYTEPAYVAFVQKPHILDATPRDFAVDIELAPETLLE